MSDKKLINLGINKTRAFKIIILFGVISLFGDLIYEGARSVNGPYLVILGANAATVGLIIGIGELLGYGIRLISGYFSDKTKAYWFFTIIGYGLLFTVPLLSLAGVWQLAAMFIISERIGKALRNPARDTLISQAAKQVGTGFGFALHEFFDQIGAIIGPFIFMTLFLTIGTSNVKLSDYQQGYSFLWIPFVLLMIFLFIAYYIGKNTKELPFIEKEDGKEPSKLSKIFWLYTVFSFITTIGFVNFALIGYHLKVNNLMFDAQIPLFYAVAMAVDAVIALLIGKMYDRLKTRRKNEKAGLMILLIIPILSMLIPAFAFSMNYMFIVMSIVVWGIVMGAHETIMRAAVADITPMKKRGTGYGIFTTTYGVALFIGSTLVGVLYDYSITFLITIFVAIEIIAILFFFLLWKNISMENDSYA